MAPTETSTQKRFRILIADDFQETRRSVRLMLSMNPDVVVVAIAANGRQAVELAHEHRPDILIMDVRMPELDGLEAFREIYQSYPKTSCIVITAQKDLDILNKAIALGVDEYLVKPFSIDELNAAVNRVIEQMRASLEEPMSANQTQNTEEHLKKLAEEYARSKRADDEAVGVFEQLAQNPHCDLHWLRTLAMLYILRREWTKLKHLAERLEQQDHK
jgi:YesN/AraC family two-component response regulator